MTKYVIPIYSAVMAYNELAKTAPIETEEDRFLLENFDAVEYIRSMVTEMLNGPLDTKLRSIGRKVPHEMDLYREKLSGVLAYSDGSLFIDPEVLDNTLEQMKDSDLFSEILTEVIEHVNPDTKSWDLWQVVSTPALLLIENMGDLRIMEWEQTNQDTEPTGILF